MSKTYDDLKRAESFRNAASVYTMIGPGITFRGDLSGTEVFGTTRDDLRMAPWLGGGDALGVAGVANRGGLVFLLDVAALRELAEPSSPSIETRGKPSHALPEGSP